jgi:hypothetical protein
LVDQSGAEVISDKEVGKMTRFGVISDGRIPSAETLASASAYHFGKGMAVSHYFSLPS